MDALLRRRQMMLAGGTPPAPLPYTPVEYIETDGTAYIDTGISGSIPRSFEMRITPMPVSSEYYFAGVRVSASSRMYPLLISSSKTAGYAFNSSAWNPTSIATSIDNRSPMDVRTHIRSGSQQIGIKQAGDSSYTNFSKTATGSFTTTLKIFLFTANNNGSPLTSCAGVRLHSVKIYVDSTYTTCYFDGQPCIYNGEYGLWDRISNTFFGNAAVSGAFTGPSNS